VKWTVWTILIAFAAPGIFVRTAQACAVCFGDPNSNMARSALVGVLFLGVVILSVLVTIASMAICWYKRAKRLESQWLTDEMNQQSTSDSRNET